MQKWRLKILISCFILFTFFHAPALANRFQLRSADSLFAQKQYTQSLEKYRQIFESGVYSPAMLLRMAYIEEGLGHTARSLYYLNLNYLSTHDERVLSKMEEVATRNQLTGYEAAPSEKFASWLILYKAQLSVGLVVACAFFLAAIIYLKKKKNVRPYLAFSGLVAICFIFLVLNNYSFASAKGIVIQAPVYLMSGPSAGADVVAIVSAGHRLTVDGQKDVWLQVRWADKPAFVKKAQLLPVEL